MASEPLSVVVNDIGYPTTGDAAQGAAGTLPGGHPTWGIAYSPVSKKLYVACEDPARIRVFGVRPLGNAVAYSFLPDVSFRQPMASFPMFLACSPTENKAYVCMGDGTVLSINTTTDRATPAPRVPQLEDWSNMTFSPDGRMSYFPDGNTLYALDERSDAPAVPIPLNVQGWWVSVTKDGAYAYCGGGPGEETNVDVARVDLVAQKEKDIVQNLNDTVNMFDVSSDNKSLFVSTDLVTVDVVDIALNKKVATIPLDGEMLGQVACSPIAPRACVVGESEKNGGGIVQVIDTVGYTKLGDGFPVDSAATNVTFDEYGNAYVGAKDVMVILHAKLAAMGPAAS